MTELQELTDLEQRDKDEREQRQEPREVINRALIDVLDEKRLSKFERFLNILRGRADVSNRADIILNPRKPQTSSYLSEDQAEFVTIAFYLADLYPEYLPLKRYAEQMLLTTSSIHGKGIDNAIKFTGAIEQTKLFSSLYGSVNQNQQTSRFGRQKKQDE